MPPRGVQRTLEEHAQAEDENDDDYDDRAPGPAKKVRGSRSRRREKPSKKKRTKYGGSDVESDENDLDSDDEVSLESSDQEEEAIETNEKGRPVRRAVKKAITYDEGSESAEDSPPSESEPDVKPKTRSPRKTRQSLIVTLKTSGTPVPSPIPRSRTTRNRSASIGITQRPTSSSSNPRGTRRSGRLSHDEEEPLVAMTDSGHHVKIVRDGSREPDNMPQRPSRGGKGIKYPSKSTIDEEPESGSALEIMASQEVMESDGQTQGDAEEALPKIVSDVHGGEAHIDSIEDDPIAVLDTDDEDRAQAGPAGEDAEDEDDQPVIGRRTRTNLKRKAESPIPESLGSGRRLTRGSLRGEEPSRPSRSKRRKTQEESSDFDPQDEHEKDVEMSESSASDVSRKARQHQAGSDSSGRRSNRLRRKVASRQSPDYGSEDQLAAEVEELKRDGKKRQRSARGEISFEPRGTRNAGKKPNYDLMRGLTTLDEDEDAAPSASQRARRPGAGGSGWRSLFSTYGPFGGAGVGSVLGGPGAAGPAGDVDSDSSDDEVMKRPRPVGGAVGMTPTSAFPPGFGLFPPAQPINSDAQQAASGTPANLGRIKDKQALADADPLGVDQHVTFDGVGGLQHHIEQLKEMVSLPLLYPEIFMRFHITPPRGVLFHGPPGTGKTLLARALASSVSSQGKKVTFYMRKGADALSKWVGEAEKQLRLLFDEARKNQPSIIFFDEIDGLAPVRSSKQEQIHASIVSTLLALMDGMDGRGQVIVIGATNRPDSVDPALRRPGRFDREFYFPLPDIDGRRAILDIHTKGWNPPLEPAIKDELAVLTKGYGGADLRALCTEAALNAVQRRYPQIYKSNEKLLIDPKTIEVTPKDFMISVKKMVPSSERSASSGASSLPPTIEPLLRAPLAAIKNLVADILPQKKRLTALEEAQYQDSIDEHGFAREKMQQTFETSRVFRPRLLIQGKPGLGQGYLAAALLSHFEGLHVQSLDLATLLGDSASSPEATIIRLFAEVKMHKPSVIYIPNIQLWYRTVPGPVVSTFKGLLRSLKPSDPILLLGILEKDDDGDDPQDIIRDLFGYSKKNQFELGLPDNLARREFFTPVVDYVKTSPAEFPDPANRVKRPLEVLSVAPPEPEKTPAPLGKEELKAQKKRDRQTLNLLKIKLQPIMDQIRLKHKKFRNPVIDDSQIRYLFDEADPITLTSDLDAEVLRAHASFRPFERGKDAHGVEGIVDQANDKFYYNLETVVIEKRLSNGYYKRPKDFLADIKRLAKDAKTIGDEERLLRANELVTNVEVDVGMIEMSEQAFIQECERVFQRELTRVQEATDKARKEAEAKGEMPPPAANYNMAPAGASEPSTATTSMGGPITLGEPMPNGRSIFGRIEPLTPSRPQSHSSVLTNGNHPANGAEEGQHRSASHNSDHEADVEGDTPMDGTDESHPNSHQHSNGTEKTHSTSSFGQSAQPMPPHSHTAPSQQLRKESGMSAPLSQTGVLTPMARDSQAADYQNDASTTQTTSGKRPSDPSSGERDHGTQEAGPNLYLFDERRSAGGSQIPSTQGKTSSRTSILGAKQLIHASGDVPNTQDSGSRQMSPPELPLLSGSQAMSPRRRDGSLQALLNPRDEAPNHPPLEFSAVRVERLLQEVVHNTSGLSVEQLEQVNSILMDVVWKTKGQWNRNIVADQVAAAFNEVMEDMEAYQEFGPSSWQRATQG
jgi:SpoVK/Ycf46/Vps4 family AAA+-type ATPase